MSDWNYCPGCGTHLRAEVEEAELHETEAQTEEITDAAVRIAEIEANRDVAVAKIQAGITEHIAGAEQAAELAHAEGKAEGLEEALAPAVTEDAANPSVVIVDAPDAESEDTPVAPPSAEEHSEPHEHKQSSYGNRGWFG